MSSSIRFTATAIAIAATFPTAVFADQEMAPVVVTATRQETRANEVISDVTVIDRKEIEQAGQDSVIDLLGRQPGVQIMQNGGPGTSAQIYVRGARADATKVLVDGMPINSMDVVGSPLRYLPLADVERIEILRGPASALYGADAVGGVIQIFTRRGQPGLRGNAFVGFGNYRAQKVSAGISGGNEQWRFHLQGQDDRTNGISALRDARNQDADKDPYSSTGFSGSLGFTPSQGNEIDLSWMTNHGTVFYDSSTGTGTFNSRTEFVNEIWNLASRNRISDDWSSTLRYSQAVDDQTSYTSATPSPLRTESNQLAWQNDIGLPLGKGLVVFERTQQKALPTSRFPTFSDVTINAAQLGWNANMGDHRWQLATRHDDHSVFGGKSTWLAGYGYQISPQWRTNVSAGSSFKAPTMYQLFIATFGNATLVPETGLNREAALIWERGSNTASATWYRNRLKNMIDFSSGTNRYENISEAMLTGWTFAYNGRYGEWSVNTALDFLEARNETTGKLLSRRAKEKLTAAIGRDWGKWASGLEVVSVGRRFNSETETFPLGGYTLINATARYSFDKSLTLEMRGNNLTNKSYATAITTNGNFAYTALGANYFIGLRYQFQ